MTPNVDINRLNTPLEETLLETSYEVTRLLKMTKKPVIPVVILCGGRGVRIGGLSEKVPKPLVPVGGEAILWHVMKIYASQGFSNFILCLGYKGDQIREHFKNNNNENWKIQFVDTGLENTKSQRLREVKDKIQSDTFFLAYGDDVANIKLLDLLKFHKDKGLVATITAVRMISHFGLVEMNERGVIEEFKEKPIMDKWMNGGFMVMNKKIFDYLNLGDLEKEVFEALVQLKQICAYCHQGGWMSMNTIKDNLELNKLWNKSQAFWKVW